MNITFFIGNGFDLNLGLKTSYKSFYIYYMSKNPNGYLAKSIKKNYKLWTDLELGLGEHLANVNDDEEIENFFNEKEMLERHLVDYLTLEDHRVIYKNEIAISESFQEKVTGFFKEFSPKEKNNYNSVVKGTDTLRYQFISFNYTKTLDKIINISNKHCHPFSKHTSGSTVYHDTLEAPLHIHGDLNQNLILGLNDVSQIKNEKLHGNPNVTDYILKPKLNTDIGYFNNIEAKKIIDNSCYICIYGMSIGDTDRIWWQNIIAWLLQDKKRRIVLYMFDNKFITNSAGAKMRYSKAQRKILSNHGIKLSNEDYDKINSQVIIIPNSNIFDLKGIEIKTKCNNSINTSPASNPHNAYKEINNFQNSGI